MKRKQVPLVVTFTSSSSPNNTSVVGTFNGSALEEADEVSVDAVLTGATGGTLDIVLQRKTGTNDWTEWARFPTLTAGQAKTRYNFGFDGSGTLTIQTLGGGTDASPGPAVMTAGTYSNVMPFSPVRVVAITGASTSAGASQTITMTPAKDYS